MTMPHLMNCSHSESGWCLDCVKDEHDSREALEETLRGQVRQMVDLFDEYRDHFGIEEDADLSAACDFEEEFNALICEFQGHNMVPDQCMRREHEFCIRCGVRREELE